MDELAAWLDRHGLGQYASALADNDVDLDVLPHLTDDDLKQLGLSLGHRRRLLAAISAPAAEPEPLPMVPDPKPAPSPPEDEAERRQLTVLFCDLVGSTELSQRLDPEELREVLRRFHDAVTGAVTTHGGHAAKLLGDGVLAYFGWPSAHEDDAQRAVRAALSCVAAVAGINAGGAPLAARAGIATGPVVIGDMRGERASEKGSVAGATPNLAARLQGAARPGEVVIHAATRRLIGATFELESRGAQPLKGFAEPVEIWRVTGAARSGSRFDALHSGRLTKFVGRAHDIGLLLDRWRLARDGEGQVVLLAGEAGIGKSRILREFTGHVAGDDCRILRYQCSPHEINAAFQPVIAEIEDTVGFRPDDPPEVRLDRLERHLAGTFSEDPREATALLAGLLGLPSDRYPAIDMAPQRRKQRTIALLADRIAGLARERPVLMLVEDIHWADPSSMEYLDALVARVQDLAVLAVMAYRPEFQPHWAGHGHVTVHSLNRLGRTDGRSIAERVAGGKALPAQVLDRIVAQTDGVPLFVEELTKTVLEAGILEEQADRYVLTGPLPALAIPETLQDSLMARLDRLAPVKRVVQAAACIGREFGARLLAAALPMAASDLDGALDQLLAAELIFRHGGTGDDARYIFKHALVQDAAYASLLTTARCSLHERLALALERSDDPDPLELARHFAEAGASKRAAGLYLAAGRRSLETSALPEAIGALERALDAMQGIPPSAERDRLELDIRISLGSARMGSLGWQHPASLAAFEPATELAKSLHDADAFGAVIWGIGSHYATRADIKRALEWLQEQWPDVQESGDTGLEVLFHMSISDQYFWRADYARSLYHTDEVRRLYRREEHAKLTTLTNHDALCHAQNFAGSLCEWIIGHPERAVTRLDEAVENAREIGHPFNLMFTLTAGSSALIYLNDFDRLLAHCDEAEKVVREEALGPFAEQVCLGQWRAAGLILRGDFALGHKMSKEGNAFWSGAEGRLCSAMMRSWLVLGLVGLGRIAEAAELNAANIAHCRTTGDRYMEPECVRLQGELALLDGGHGPAAAEGLFREAIAIARDHGAKSWELRAAMSLGHLLESRDRRAEAAGCVEPVLGWFTEGLESHDLVQARALMERL